MRTKSEGQGSGPAYENRLSDRKDCSAACENSFSDREGHLLTREREMEEIQKFTMFSNVFMSVALQDIGACQYVLRILTGDSSLVLWAVKSQYTLMKLASHDAWLDVLAEDMEGRFYALEIQQKNVGDHPRRVRFYESMIDSEFLRKGQDYASLPEVRMFYIGAGDFLKSGMTMWEVEKRQSGSGKAYYDGLSTTYVNAGVKDDSEISRLMQYFKTADPEDMSHGELSRRVRFLKKSEEGIKKLCEVTERFWQWGFDSGEESGIRKGENSMAYAFIQTALKKGCSLEEIQRKMQESFSIDIGQAKQYMESFCRSNFG